MSAQVHNESPEIEAVRFSGGALQVLRDAEGRAWMLLRPACKALELDAEAQRMIPIVTEPKSSRQTKR